MEYIDHPVHDRLFFAERRLNDLRSLNNGDIGGAPHRERQPLLQEFFFHLGGAIDFLAQEVNKVRGLGLSEEKVTVKEVRAKLVNGDESDQAISSSLNKLHPKASREPLPTDPYSEEGSHFRIMLFRHWATHVGVTPLMICIFAGNSGKPYAQLFLDPRSAYEPGGQGRPSKREAFEELALFLELVTSKCNSVLRELGFPTP